MKDYQITENFSFYELTNTSHTVLLERNREYAEKLKDNLNLLGIQTAKNKKLKAEVDGTPKTNSYIGITVGSNKNTTVTSNIVSSFNLYGIELGNISDNGIVANNIIKRIFNSLVSPTAGSGFAYTGTNDSDNCIITNNSITDCFMGYTSPFGKKIIIESNNVKTNIFDKNTISTIGFNIQGRSTLVSLNSNIIEGFNIGILAAENSVVNESINIIGNIFKDCNYAVRTLLKIAVINGNTFFNCGVANTSPAIGIESSGKFNVSNNVFLHDTPNNVAIMVKNDADHGGTISGNILSANISLTETITSWVALNVKDIIYLNSDRKVTYGSATPGTGTFNVGDIIYNTSPTAGGNIGWVCTVAGTPGTWNGFGLIN